MSSIVISRALILLTVSVALTSPAMACNLHAPGQMGAFHRYNPFAVAMQRMPPASSPALAQAEVKASKADEAVKKAQDEKRDQKADEDAAGDLEDRIPDTQASAQSRGANQ